MKVNFTIIGMALNQVSFKLKNLMYINTNRQNNADFVATFKLFLFYFRYQNDATLHEKYKESMFY